MSEEKTLIRKEFKEKAKSTEYSTPEGPRPELAIAPKDQKVVKK